MSEPSAKVDADKARILAWLERRESIARETEERAAHLEAAPRTPAGLAGLPPEVDVSLIAEVEEEYHRARGRVRHESANGRVRWLTPEELEQRKKGRSRRKNNSTYYGPAISADRKWVTGLLFNAGVVVAGAVLVYLFLR